MNRRLNLIDNDHGEITVTLDGKEVRGWSYANDNERRTKMLSAREYTEGWYDGFKHGLDWAEQMVMTTLEKNYPPDSIQ
jgi:hypothetical protein